MFTVLNVTSRNERPHCRQKFKRHQSTKTKIPQETASQHSYKRKKEDTVVNKEVNTEEEEHLCTDNKGRRRRPHPILRCFQPA